MTKRKRYKVLYEEAENELRELKKQINWKDPLLGKKVLNFDGKKWAWEEINGNLLVVMRDSDYMAAVAKRDGA